MEEKKRVRLTDKIGKDIYTRVMQREVSEGGVILEVLGVQGSGKTSLLFSIAEEIMERYPKELVFFRDSYLSQCQFNRFEKWQIFSDNGVGLRFRDIAHDTFVDLPITRFDSFKTLLSKAQPQQLNVIFFKNNYRYIDFIQFLRLYKGWQTLIIDEYEDIAPLRCKGKQWKKNEELSNEFKQIRKGLVNLFCDTQRSSDIDWRVRSKIMCHVYLYGSRVDRMSPINQGAVNSLPVGKLFIDYGHALYGKGSFNPFPPVDPVLEAYDDTSSHF